jgi:enoyl-CoA hydratase/carnithine racemase
MPVQYEKQGHIGIITLSRPEARGERRQAVFKGR